MSETPDIVEQACEWLDRNRAAHPERGMIMDLLDEISRQKGNAERLRSALAARTEECARVADEIARKGGDDGWRTGKEIAAAIRALPSPPSEKEGG